MNLNIFGAYAAAILAGGIALLWLSLKHQTPAHWSFAAGMLLLAADVGLAGAAAGESSSQAAMAWQMWRAWFTALLPGAWLTYSLCYARGNYWEFLSRWRWAIVGVVVVPLGLAALATAMPSEAPAGMSGTGAMPVRFVPLNWPGKALELVLLLGVLLALINLEKTFRCFLGLMRWRVKFVFLGLATLLGGRLYASSQSVLFSGIQLSLIGVLAASLLVGSLLIAFSLVRGGFREIDVYPSHAFLLGSLVVLLTGSYLLVVGLLAEAVSRWGGDVAFQLESLLVLLAIVALGMVFLSDRVRQRAQLFISRHLRRPFYDYRRVWTAFTERTASRLDRTEYCRSVVTLVAETFNTLSVTIWILDGSQQRLEFGASTALTEGTAGELTCVETSITELTTALQARRLPFDLDRTKAAWAQMLRRGNPDYFSKGGGRVCVPLVAGGQPLGFILLADRVSGVSFTPEDYDLLKCIGDQVAAGLLNLQLSRKLVEAKELEAFQAMSAFFVHDLKNTASTLSMMLQNLPLHFGNPDFRADASRGIAKSVERLNGLIERLTLIRRGFSVNPVATDLNGLIAVVLQQFPPQPGLEVSSQLQPLSRVSVDADQLSQVLTNLLLNARDAVGRPGHIEVGTQVQGDHVVISVADNGCGMSADFVNRRLFRPFQTTKNKGLGIGLFQSRMIVEAHGGRIEVQSEAGRGSVFRVRLPLSIRSDRTNDTAVGLPESAVGVGSRESLHV